MAAKIDMKNLPVWAKAIIAVIPGIIIAVLVVFLVVNPKKKEIVQLDKKIDKQNNEIAEMQAKVAKLDELKAENKLLLERLEELKEFLPEEKEISTLLKQVSDLGIGNGLNIKSWKPKPRKKHPSGIIYEVPVDVDVEGEFHNLGYFLSSLTKLNRIVNITNMKLSQSRSKEGVAVLPVKFSASTFTAVPEEELAQAAAAPAKGKKGRK